jgi:hypothetical protein
MLLSELKEKLQVVQALHFTTSGGASVPPHFHITEVGQSLKQFIDCGGTIRQDNAITLQLWASSDVDHRLTPQKLLSIIDLSINKLNIGNYPVEVEYQSDTIGKYGLEFIDGTFVLTNTHTACLASDACGVPVQKNLVTQSCCAPGSGCC